MHQVFVVPMDFQGNSLDIGYPKFWALQSEQSEEEERDIWEDSNSLH